MNLLETYIDFSIKYKILVGNDLNNDLKYFIWKIYQKLVASEILQNFISKNIRKCRDCNFTRWNILTGRYSQFYYVPACNTPEFYFTDVLCCMKYICSKQCRFNLKCSYCNQQEKYSPINRDYDIGWNPIESQQILNWKCSSCNNINQKSLVWNHENHDSIVIGKLI